MRNLVRTKNDILTVCLVLALPFFMYFITMNQVFLLPFYALGGLLAFLGLLFQKKTGLNAGLLALGMAYLTGNISLGWSEISLINLIRGMGPFFMLVFTWILGSNNILSRRIRGNNPKDGYDEHMRNYEISSVIYSLYTVVSGFMISLLGMFILKYSYLGIEFNDLTSALVTIGFTLLIFVIIYLIVQVFPSWVDEKEEEGEK